MLSTIPRELSLTNITTMHYDLHIHYNDAMRHTSHNRRHHILIRTEIWYHNNNSYNVTFATVFSLRATTQILTPDHETLQIYHRYALKSIHNKKVHYYNYITKIPYGTNTAKLCCLFLSSDCSFLNLCKNHSHACWIFLSYSTIVRNILRRAKMFIIVTLLPPSHPLIHVLVTIFTPLSTFSVHNTEFHSHLL